MPENHSQYLGKKYSCPGCHRQLKFRRPPTTLLQTCPNCRRKLRLQDREAAASNDELLREAIDSLIKWEEPTDEPYEYRRDPKLDVITELDGGIFQFNQPWPEVAGEVVYENAEVLFNHEDSYGSVLARKAMFEGQFRRVTVVRTGQVEEMAVMGHWWGPEHHEAKIGLLERSVVRILNRIVTAKNFVAIINRIERTTIASKRHLNFFVNLAIDTTPGKSKPLKTR